MDVERGEQDGEHRRIRTGPLPRLPDNALSDPITLEHRVLPLVLLLGFGGLIAIQIVLRVL